MSRNPNQCPYCFGENNHDPGFDCRPKYESPGRARHILKTWPDPFKALGEGRKTFEYRKDDRGFEVGDMLVLTEWEPVPVRNDDGGFTGRELIRWVTYIARGPAFGIPDGYCVMSVSERRPS